MIYIWAKKGHLFFVAMTVLLFNLRYWMLFAKPEKLLLVVAYVLVGMKALKSKPRSTQAWLFYLLSMGIVGTIHWLATYKPF